MNWNVGVAGWKVTVFWGLVGIGIAGILIGYRYRAGALMAATFVVIAGCVVALRFEVPAAPDGFFLIFLAIATLQCAYLLGLVLAIVLRHRRAE